MEKFLSQVKSSTEDGQISKYNFIFILWGFFSILELICYSFNIEFRPIGEIFAYISPDIITQSRPNSLYPVVLSSKFDKTVSMIMLICFMLMSFYSGLLFLKYLVTKYKNFF
jgi:hypothetical protein